MSEMITESSDPALWGPLHDQFLQNLPGNVVLGGKIYKVHSLTSGEIAFTIIEMMDYLDSRSLKPSEKAQYDNLKK